MAKDITSSTPPDAIELSAYPSCDDCLTWSEDGLAVAAHENIFLLQPIARCKQSYSSETLCINQFTVEEWPEQPLSAVKDLSVGEEQTDSSVVALSWSPQGLGLHRRSVLAVLTSNLLLSIWETDGSQRGWRRTCIVNQYLSTHVGLFNAHPAFVQHEKSPRIRAFAWSKPLKKSRQDQHLLATVDDKDKLTVFSIGKRDTSGYGSWLLSSVCADPLKSQKEDGEAKAQVNPLQSQIIIAAPVAYLAIHEWHVGESTACDDLRKTIKAEVVYRRFNQQQESKLILQLVMDQDQLRGSFIDSESPSVQDYAATRTQSSVIASSLDDVQDWREALQMPYRAFEQKFCLNNSVRIRFWGRVSCPSRVLEAACVTFHPRDAYEYTSAVHEKSWLLFRLLGEQNSENVTQMLSTKEVFDTVLRYLTDHADSRAQAIVPLDRTLLRIITAFSLRIGRADEVTRLRSVVHDMSAGPEESHALVRQPENDTEVVNASKAQTPWDANPHTETCIICNADMPAGEDFQAGRCEIGHTFPRCNLSFISLQEPGISKYCSGCERQFLNISKLGPPMGSLTFQLFDAFDVCPYCGGKYRG